jgi:hypothetical protein
MRKRQEVFACPENPQPPFTRSLSDVLYTDHLATLDGLRKIYIPRHSPNELADFPQALEWARENLEVFQETKFGIGIWLNELPEAARFHSSCISFLLIAREELFRNDRGSD